jgi:hypothetical protein
VAQQAAEILVSMSKVVGFPGPLTLGYLKIIACSSFYEVDNFPFLGAGRYFSSLLVKVCNAAKLPARQQRAPNSQQWHPGRQGTAPGTAAARAVQWV